MTTFYVNQSTGTSADALEAYGLARLLETLMAAGGRTRPITIGNDGGYYTVVTDGQAVEAGLARDQRIQPLRALRAGPKDDTGGCADSFNLDEIRARNQRYTEALKQLSNPRLRGRQARLEKHPELEQLKDLEPPTEFSTYSAINGMKARGSFNDLVRRWDALDTAAQASLLRLLLDYYSAPEQNERDLVGGWQTIVRKHGLDAKVKAETTLLQIVNPSSGKGGNNPKANGIGIGNLDGPWMREYLKFLGFFVAAAPLTIRGSKDRKIYVLMPRDVSLSIVAGLMRDYRNTLWSSTAVKMDVLGALQLARIYLVRRALALETPNDAEAYLLGSEPLSQMVDGLSVASYKDLGNAVATMNLADLFAPDWLPSTETLENATSGLALVDEHIRVIQSIRTPKGDEGGEEYMLLRAYRDFISGRDLNRFWDFTTHYSGYLMHKREAEPRFGAPQLSLQGLEDIVIKTQPKLADLFTPSFRNVAGAIRNATVRPQLEKARAGKTRYEIRYGLGQRLVRKAYEPREFAAELMAFIGEYNTETVREEEKLTSSNPHALTLEERRGNRLRPRVSDEDLKNVLKLIDDYGPELVANALVACGYAKTGAPAVGETRVEEEEISGADAGESGLDSEGDGEQ
jgi:hypothetical protein